MFIQIENDFLERLIGNAYKTGYMACQKALSPETDHIRKTETGQWLRSLGLKVTTFNRLVRAGAIQPFRKGHGRNTPLYFSRADILQAFDNFAQTNRADNSFAIRELRENLAKLDIPKTRKKIR